MSLCRLHLFRTLPLFLHTRRCTKLCFRNFSRHCPRRLLSRTSTDLLIYSVPRCTWYVAWCEPTSGACLCYPTLVPVMPRFVTINACFGRPRLINLQRKLPSAVVACYASLSSVSKRVNSTIVMHSFSTKLFRAIIYVYLVPGIRT